MPTVNNISNPNGGGGNSLIPNNGIGAPGHCTGLEFTTEGEGTTDVKVKFKVTDSSEGVWGGTKLVIKEGSEPEDENDGIELSNHIVKNRFKDTFSAFRPLITQSTETKTTNWYMSAFPYSPDGVVNRMKSGTFKKSISVIEIEPTFETASWAKIKDMVNKGTHTQFFNVDDVKPFVYDGINTNVRISSINNDGIKIELVDLIPNPENIPYVDDIEHFCTYDNNGRMHQYLENNILPKIENEVGYDLNQFRFSAATISEPYEDFSYKNFYTKISLLHSGVTGGQFYPSLTNKKRKLIGNSDDLFRSYWLSTQNVTYSSSSSVSRKLQRFLVLGDDYVSDENDNGTWFVAEVSAYNFEQGNGSPEKAYKWDIIKNRMMEESYPFAVQFYIAKESA